MDQIGTIPPCDESDEKVAPKLGAGIDVSHHQGPIDWQAAFDDLNGDGTGGQPWVYIKATEGVDWTDRRFEENVQGAHNAGFAVGAYHFATIKNGKIASADASQEARFFTDRTRPFQELLTLLPCTDVELGGIDRRESRYCREWMFWHIQDLSEILNTRPLVYTGKWTLRWIYKKEPLPPALRECPLWWAEYSNGDAPRGTRPGWEPTAWQYTAKGTVDGIRGNVDRNLLVAPKASEILRYG